MHTVRYDLFSHSYMAYIECVDVKALQTFRVYDKPTKALLLFAIDEQRDKRQQRRHRT